MSSAFSTPAEEHPFAPFVRILGKGKTGTRSLTQTEAREAFGMILRGEAEPLQVGAFLMLLRVKEESPEELAGFVQAARDAIVQPPASLSADLDWSSYAGKRHQHPWFILSLLLLSGAGYRVFIHGADGHTAGRLYTEQAFRALGLPVASDWDEVEQQLAASQLCYLPLRHLCPPLHELMQLKPLLGLRSPVNTLTRMLNPLGADAAAQSIFHPAYANLHQTADQLLGQPRALVFKGESGEVEVKPHARTRLMLQDGDVRREVELERHFGERVAAVDGGPAVEPVLALWRDEQVDDYGLAAVLMTTTAALLLLDPTLDASAARTRAESLWAERDRARLPQT